ncbi:monocarboxylate transporter 9-like [Glandiceps talaboti]
MVAGVSLCAVSGSVGGLLGPPLAGFIYDSTQDYNNAFYFYGACMSFTGLTILVLEPFTRRCDRKLNEEVETNNDDDEYNELAEADRNNYMVTGDCNNDPNNQK